MLGGLLHKINVRPWIPKIDLEKISTDKREKAIKYHELVEKGMNLYKQMIESARQLNIIKEESGRIPCYDIPDGHHILILANGLKQVMIEVNELLYGEKCEFFDKR